jgi:hypothetical protein
MTLRNYIPISIGVFVLTMAIARYFAMPLLPFAVILLGGETLLGFALEEGRVPNFLRELFRPPRHLH